MEELEILSEHFTRNHLRIYASNHGLDLTSTKFLSMIRDPWEQLCSNPNYPLHLEARGLAISEAWMRELVEAPGPEESTILHILCSYPWLMNMQTQYLMLDETRLEPDR